MKLAQAKDYFKDGMITGFDVLLEPMAVGSYYLSLSGRGDRQWTLQTAIGHTKVYASADAVLADIARITGRVASGFSVSV
jgi:hypothetical protein